MARGTYKPEWQRALIVLSSVAVAVTIVGTLYWARAVLIPFALAVFLTFVLAPLVRAAERRGLGRTPAVVLVVGMSVLLFGATVFVIGNQIAGLTATLPDYAENIKAKAGVVRGWMGGAAEPSRLGRLLEELQAAVAPAPRPASDGPPTVVVESPKPAWSAQLQDLISPAAEALGQAAFSFILVVFMLIKKEDLRNRLLRLAGAGRVTTATKAMDDASRRVSRYLLVQLLLNVSFGVVATVGLLLLGVPFAPLWGFVATLMRYVPYIGTWIGLIPPAVFSLAVSEGNSLWQPAAVLALFLGLEAICNNIFEPWLYGSSLGMSEVAQLVAAGFWAFLWGPVGLILSGPMSTCLLVLGKYVPALRFLEVLLGDDPPLAPSVAYFQRLTARDQDEASRVAHAAARPDDPAAVFDEVIVPALRLTKAAAADGDLSADEEAFILAATREIADELTDGGGVPAVPPDDRVRVLACPARDDADRVALEAFARLIGAEKWEVEVSAVETLTSEVIDVVGKYDPAVVLVGALPPGGMAHTRYLCKRLRARFPDLKLIVGRFGQQPDDEEATDPKELGADAVVTTLTAARDQFAGLYPVLHAVQEADAGAVRPTPPARGSAAGRAVGTTPA